MNITSRTLILFLAASGSGGLGLATANKDKAKAGKGKVSEEVSLHRERQHQCDSMYLFGGSFVYQGGCGGNAFEVLISCENKGRKEESRNGVICNYYEETLVSLCCS
jgi:hypothetical protein